MNVVESFGKVVKSFNERLRVNVVYTDVSKGFDNFPHGRLIEKLSAYAINSSLVNTEAESTETVRLRLENGGSPCAGRVEIHYKGLWGTVHEYNWDLMEATVVCRELKCGTAVSVLVGSHFGPGSGPIVIGDILCNGTEHALRDCLSPKWGHHAFPHANDAGVICSEHRAPRLVPGNSQCAGRLEVQFGDTWKTVCGLDWDLKNANVVCAQLHCGVVMTVSISAHSGGSTLLIGNEAFECVGNETQLQKCPQSSYTHQDCSGHNNVTLRCSGTLVNAQVEKTETVSLRLENGGSPCAGRVEIHYKGLWGTVDDIYWDLPDAQVVCRELDCGTAVSALGGSHFGPGSGPIVTGKVWCSGTERALRDCPSAEWSHYTNPYANHSGVICSEHRAPKFKPGNSQCFGRLEIQFGDSWKTVCGLDWNLKNAHVACAQLHCGVAVSVTSSAHSGGGTVLMANEVFACAGNETELQKCPRSSSKYQDCSGHNNVTLMCSREYKLNEEKTPLIFANVMALGFLTLLDRVQSNLILKVSHVIMRKFQNENWWPRLVHGGSRCDGRIEIYYNGSWGRPQHTLWDLNGAHVVCRQLGCGCALETYNSSKYGESDGSLRVYGIQCLGQESQLQDCKISSPLISSVTDSSGVGVFCSETEHIQLRLSDGESPCAGRVEIYYSGTWGSICDDSWDVVNAEVVCKQLGCGDALDMTLPSSYGQASGPIWLKDVKCSGNESFLWECPSAPLAQQDDCSHKEDVRIVCSEHKEIRLVNGKHRCEGRVEVFYNETWGTVCSESLDYHDAEVICKQLHCGALQSIEDEAQVFGAGTGPIWLDEIECLSDESTLWQCQRDPWGQHNCKHTEDAGVVCSGNSTNVLNGQVSFEAQISSRVSMFLFLTESDAMKDQLLSSTSCHQQSDSLSNVRLNGGSSNCSGRVEIMCDERWGTLCGDFWDITDANVVCRQLRCGFALSAQGEIAVPHGERVIWQNDVKCKGSESSLSNCLFQAPAQKECNRNKIASVVCSGQERESSSIPVVVSLTLGVLLIFDLIALLMVMRRKLQMKGLCTGNRDSSLGLYQGIYEEIENIPSGKKTDHEYGPVISASIDSLNRVEYYTSDSLSDNNLGSENPEVISNSIPGEGDSDPDRTVSGCIKQHSMNIANWDFAKERKLFTKNNRNVSRYHIKDNHQLICHNHRRQHFETNSLLFRKALTIPDKANAEIYRYWKVKCASVLPKRDIIHQQESLPVSLWMVPQLAV
ncbi:scavenger receptor cysteine-rich type 1 protein M130-like [Stegostoma tigrinum]|uniref:scavenger receptor cysteine-rich type 1 protein M130-like n=1 Tax=Stegostoma tigrinum TaxID=3053191 RepID=UPI0028706339|nr:scavenger receptor cysteine-rich type 1 protein M130-like [Stegostoma tigrinum]